MTRECSTNTRKNQGASESATATIQAAGADRLRRGQLPQCAPRLTSVRRGAVQPLWRPATGRVLRLWRTERYRLKDFHALFSALGLKEQLRSHVIHSLVIEKKIRPMALCAGL